MSRINVLEKHVAELIAAGEVVERPSSVIKELVENSIDAGATTVTVEIKNGGTTFMRVADNGCGIERDDIPKAFLRHATSKVKLQDDLDSIATLGFRGEALASVSAVANVELITCADTEEIGTFYSISGGDEISSSDIGCPKGTTIIVRDLFFNIPARQKFLKKDVSEGNAVAQVIDRIALSHPEISFTFIRDSKTVLKTSGDGQLKSAIYSVFGRDFAKSLVEVKYELNGIKVEGYISKPEAARPTRSMQTFFVNNRYVKTRTAAAAIDEAAKGTVMVGKFLSCVLNISMSFSAVDVNVHPAKIEVRFVNERPIFDAVYHAVKSALLSISEHKKANFFPDKSNRPNIQPFTYSTVKTTPAKESASETSFTKDTKDFNHNFKVSKSVATKPLFERNLAVNDFEKERDAFLSSLERIKTDENKRKTSLDIFEDAEPCKANAFENKPDSLLVKTQQTVENNFATKTITNNEAAGKSESKTSIAPSKETEVFDSILKNDATDFKFIGEAFSTYIIIEQNNKLLLIDKHALHERIIYEKLKKEADTYSQMLLSPIVVSLQKDEYNAAVQNLGTLNKCGFEAEDFGNGNLLVRSAPQYLDSADVENSIIEMAAYLLQNKNDINTEQMDWIFHNVACRAAVKAGNKSTAAELVDLVKQMFENPQLKNCPHGRPVCIELTKNEIEKQFGRV